MIAMQIIMNAKTASDRCNLMPFTILQGMQQTKAYIILANDCCILMPFTMHSAGNEYTILYNHVYNCMNIIIMVMVSISVELVMSRYVAESITTDAGCFGHIGLCAVRDKIRI